MFLILHGISYMTDGFGHIEKIDLKAEAKLADSDFKRIYCLIVNRK